MSAFHHVPVLLDEVVAAVAPALRGRENATHVDLTLGGAGHAAAIARAFAPARLVGFDRDQAALDAAAIALAELEGTALHLVHAPFSELAARLDALGLAEVDAMLADIGVSSHQLDSPARGFSFRADGPLDMRMDPSRGRPAHARLQETDAPTLARVLRDYGDEPDARRIAEAIVAAAPRTTLALAETVSDAMSARQRRNLGTRIHPATRTFQAIRIWVNGELDELAALLEAGPERLAVGGRLLVITFHSLEDRLVKRRFRALSTPPPVPRELPLRDDERPRARFCIPRGHASGLEVSEAERDRNPRARSARLRVLERARP